MENEQVFEVNAELRGLEHMDSPSSYPSTQKGHDTGKAAFRGLESEGSIRNEESPLLSPNREDEGAEGSDHGVGETREPPKWDGERDFEGRPWWNKPSVNNP